MQCEVCGRKIFGTPIRGIIEGVQMTVCSQCGKLSEGFWEPKPQPKPRLNKSMSRQPVQVFSKRKPKASIPEMLEIADDYAHLIRQAREDFGLSHEDLGRKTQEKVSVIRKIESGKMIPDLGLAEKLEHTLKITLRVPVVESDNKFDSTSKPSGATLGDLINFELKKEGAKK
ncbi:MAG: TIGR00270 family protein [Candidatus Bathyarchaeota archaeon]|nr:multiprotein bridging factor aMBF1 [Candidatus Bathyarchaeum tardum]WGM89308.1 MAG: multiprotein bridging factor aMBF1 [Candidatus Bathyarchaeum tardum]WNZ28412.1 MAG: TIGR00270 family protein [Candidatus Bathyarchaeota archaeon]